VTGRGRVGTLNLNQLRDCCGALLVGGIYDAIRLIETSRVHHAARRRGGRVATRSACAQDFRPIVGTPHGLRR
jgi:hypothetical protein